MKNNVARGFDIVTESGRKPRARFWCVECGANVTVSCAGDDGRITPAFAEKAARRLGWQAWALSKTKTFCPKCLQQKPKTDTDSELRKVVTMPPTLVLPKEPTPDQRLAVRNMLDKSFDDKAGMYLDGMTDQVIAERAGVPRVIVERIREVGYGPIKVDPALVAKAEEKAAKAKADKPLSAKQAGKVAPRAKAKPAALHATH